jgi:hypothetical protein
MACDDCVGGSKLDADSQKTSFLSQETARNGWRSTSTRGHVVVVVRGRREHLRLFPARCCQRGQLADVGGKLLDRVRDDARGPVQTSIWVFERIHPSPLVTLRVHACDVAFIAEGEVTEIGERRCHHSWLGRDILTVPGRRPARPA